MEGTQPITCLCPACGRVYQDHVSPEVCEGPWQEGRLVRLCTACWISQLSRERRVR
jgi:hypothetical protein